MMGGMSTTTLDREQKRKIMAEARCDGRRAFNSQREASAGGEPFFRCGHCRKWHRCLPLDALTIATALAYAEA
jgi:hypothetical protein